jgi:hypothetical protein
MQALLQYSKLERSGRLGCNVFELRLNSPPGLNWVNREGAPVRSSGPTPEEWIEDSTGQADDQEKLNVLADHSFRVFS